MVEEIRRITEFGERLFPKGTARVPEVLDDEIIIEGFELKDSNLGKAVLIFAKDLEGNGLAIGTWSKVLIDQLKRAEGHFPLRAKIVRQNRYYTFA